MGLRESGCLEDEIILYGKDWGTNPLFIGMRGCFQVGGWYSGEFGRSDAG